MSAWKELQLALQTDISDEEFDYYKIAWEQECREDECDETD